MGFFGVVKGGVGVKSEAKVKELIDGDTKTWKTKLVKDILNEEEAILVCSLPISSSGLPDKLIWAHTKTGQFDVKSTYHLELCRKNREKREVSKSGTENWKVLLQLNVPGVVKMFLWKAMNNCLPIKFYLSCRKIVKDYFCPICKMQKETVSHALWSCGGAMDVWADNLSPVQKWASIEKDIQELWADWCNKLKREELELTTVVLRRFWMRRNSFVFENKFEGPDVIFRQATDFLLQFQEA
ncbi:hypothetical protein F2P56_011306 [Juglans regia]|uniref:Reverse transcriptase zinc-binding domain-containing protein n=2 Tax=Juglans regia TaxID=51240 RepID=A0A833XT29_JUGRE|nr:uncharacterized protein LOC108998759 [Juglans regia]KAF5470817.1 hypothetical protein F2P56_011306 [Juglans regia]